jgi:hypothetical protein
MASPGVRHGVLQSYVRFGAAARPRSTAIMGRRLPLAIPMHERLLVAVAHSRAAVPDSANPSHQANGRFSDQFARSGPTGVHPLRSFTAAADIPERNPYFRLRRHDLAKVGRLMGFHHQPLVTLGHARSGGLPSAQPQVCAPSIISPKRSHVLPSHFIS